MREVRATHRKSFLADCETVDMPFASQVAEPGAPYRFVYFPLSGCISQLAGVPQGRALEVSMVGDEGMIGASALLGVEDAPLQGVVQGSGASLRMPRKLFERHAASDPRLDRLVRRYLHLQTLQLAQSSVCTRYHMVDERLARWLLMMQDRLHSDEFPMTHEFLAVTLGVRRAGVTQAAGVLSGARLITYHRGQITVVDRAGLLAAACACYAADNRAYARLMQ